MKTISKKSIATGAAVAGIAAGVVGGAASATEDGAQGTTPAGEAAAAGAQAASSGKTGWLVFDKNPKDPTRSELRLTVLKDGKAIKTLKMRAGAGSTTDNCETGRGWLPNGRYDMKMFASYPGTVVRGKAFYLEDKKCNDGSTVRSELFIHTSHPWSANRYYSNGCVKLSNTNIDTLYRTLHYHFPDVKEGGKLPFQLKVVS